MPQLCASPGLVPAFDTSTLPVSQRRQDCADRRLLFARRRERRCACHLSPKAPTYRSGKGALVCSFCANVQVTNVTNLAIQSLAQRSATLERVHLSYCEKISVPAVAYLLNKLPHLTHLSVTGIAAFRTPELQQFCRTAPEVSSTQWPNNLH